MKSKVFVFLVFVLVNIPAYQSHAQSPPYTVRLRLSDMDTLWLGGKVTEWVVNVYVDVFDSSGAFVPPSSGYLYNWYQDACAGFGYGVSLTQYGRWEEDWDGSFVKTRPDCCEPCPYQAYNLYVEVVIDDVGYSSQPVRLPDDGIYRIPTFSLAQNYPNPFNPGTRIDFQLKEPGYTRLAIYDLLGREVEVLIDGHRNAGDHSVSWVPQKEGSGVFVYRLTFVDAAGKRSTLARKMIVAK